jgi:hypothetical protein
MSAGQHTLFVKASFALLDRIAEQKLRECEQGDFSRFIEEVKQVFLSLLDDEGHGLLWLIGQTFNSWVEESRGRLISPFTTHEGQLLLPLEQ